MIRAPAGKAINSHPWVFDERTRIWETSAILPEGSVLTLPKTNFYVDDFNHRTCFSNGEIVSDETFQWEMDNAVTEESQEGADQW